MARPKSEDKKQALLEAATAAFAQSGIAASTSAIARSAGVAEGTLFRYFATKDDLLNELYLSIKSGLVQVMVASLKPNESRPKENARNIWNSYIDWGMRKPMEHKAIRRMSLSERITDETRTRVKEMFPELNEICQLSVKPIFLSDAYRTFGDALFLSLAETTIEYASNDPQRAPELIALGFEAMWQALHEDTHRWTTARCMTTRTVLRWSFPLPSTAGRSARSTMCLKSAGGFLCSPQRYAAARWST